MGTAGQTEMGRQTLLLTLLTTGFWAAMRCDSRKRFDTGKLHGILLQSESELGHFLSLNFCARHKYAWAANGENSLLCFAPLLMQNGFISPWA